MEKFRTIQFGKSVLPASSSSIVTQLQFSLSLDNLNFESESGSLIPLSSVRKQ